MKTGPATVAAKFMWRLRYDLVAVVVVAAVMTVVSERISVERFVPVVSLLGVVVSIFIGFRLRNAYTTWLDAQKFWEAVGVNSRAFMNALTIVDNRTPQMAEISDRMLRRQVRHVWELAAELRGTPSVPEVRALTPEDPSDATSAELLTYQAADSRNLTRSGLIDSKARNILTNLNTTESMTAGSLENIRDEPFPIQYALFVRSLVWVFGILVCAATHSAGITGITGMMLSAGIIAIFVIAERLGESFSQPLDNTFFGLPMDRFCVRITSDLLGAHHRLARLTAP